MPSFPHPFSATECIARNLMPQVDSDDIPSLLTFATLRGVLVGRYSLNPRSIRGRQRVDRSKIKAFDRRLVLEKPILVSAEPLILDGNHRWFYADYHRLPAIDAWQFSLPFVDALQFILDFPKSYTYGDPDAPIAIRN